MNIYTEKKRLEKLDYMHANPVKRRLVSEAGDWPWSSWRFYYLGTPACWRWIMWNEFEGQRGSLGFSDEEVNCLSRVNRSSRGSRTHARNACVRHPRFYYLGNTSLLAMDHVECIGSLGGVLWRFSNEEAGCLSRVNRSSQANRIPRGGNMSACVRHPA
ncbi:MAG: hypothetical protein LAO31_12935 [Acidobacteriia bacterium]|nr:hypothetical protein [Terriglobia bacterium]